MQINKHRTLTFPETGNVKPDDQICHRAEPVGIVEQDFFY